MDKGDQVEVVMPKWLSEAKESDTCNIEGTIKIITEKAILLKTVDKGEIWLPKSQIDVQVKDVYDMHPTDEEIDDVPF